MGRARSCVSRGLRSGHRAVGHSLSFCADDTAADAVLRSRLAGAVGGPLPAREVRCRSRSHASRILPYPKILKHGHAPCEHFETIR